MNWMTSGKKRLSKKQANREGGFLVPQRHVVKDTSHLPFPPRLGTTVNLGGNLRGERSTDVIRLKSQWEACVKKKTAHHPAAGASHDITASNNLVPLMTSAHEHQAPVSTVPPLVEQDVKFFNDGMPMEVILQNSNRTDKRSSQYHNHDQNIKGCNGGGGDTSLQVVYYCSILHRIIHGIFVVLVIITSGIFDTNLRVISAPL